VPVSLEAGGGIPCRPNPGGYTSCIVIFASAKADVMRSVVFVGHSVSHLVCVHDNESVHMQTTTKHGRHGDGQGVTVWKLLNFSVDPNLM